ncbi:MAG TPA: hypothetical protein VHQ86_05805, partial [Candidatus Saccharimonadia bacterium]|nr:hypothetical protein [Candidatus Saccharimonadia bacterium]
MTLATFTSVCGVISTVLAVYCGLPYLVSIVRGHTKPHQFSWIILTIMNVIVTISQFLEGGRSSILISFTFTIYSAIILGLSYRYGLRDTSKYDRWLLALSLVTIVVWVLTRNNDVAIWLTVLIDIFATTMIMLKVKADAGSEDPIPWLLAGIAYVFSILSLIGTPLGILYVRPIYGFL